MFETIVVTFEDPYGYKVTCEIPIYASDEVSFEVQAEDKATEWYYEVAEEQFSTLWNEQGGGTDFEYETNFDTYLSNSFVDWKFKEKKS